MADTGGLPRNVLFLDQRGNVQLDWAVFLERISEDCYFQTLQSFSKANLPTSNVPIGGQIYVTDEAGGAVPAFFDGAAWRRCTDRNVIS